MPRQKPYRHNNRAEEVEIRKAGEQGLQYVRKLLPRLEKVWLDGYKKHLDNREIIDVRDLTCTISDANIRTGAQLELIKHVITRQIVTELDEHKEGKKLFLTSLPYFEKTCTPYGPNWTHIIRTIYMALNDADEANHFDFYNHHPDCQVKLTWFYYAGEHNFKLEKL